MSSRIRNGNAPSLRKLKFKKRVGGASQKSPSALTFKKRLPKNKTDQEGGQEDDQDNNQKNDNHQKPKLTFKKPLKKKNLGPIQFGKDGYPIPSRENLDRMTLEEAAEFCQEWTVDRHLNILLVQLVDYVSVSMNKPKSDKCQAVLKYKKDFPSGAVAQKAISYENTYESFNWRPEHTIRYRGNDWILPHSPNFKSEITAKFSKYRLTDKEIVLNRIDQQNPTSAFKYQVFVEKLLDPMNPYRGVMAFHGLGSGKSRTAVITSTRFIQDGKKILVLTPGALREKFISELFIWGSQEHGIGIKNYKTMPDKERIGREKAARKAIKHYYDVLTYNEKGVYDKLKALTNPENGMLENRLIIVDEIHNLGSRMKKTTNISRQVYHFLMDRLYNCKLLFLSGTPLLNDPYELGVQFNLLRGKFRTKQGTFTLFPENEEEFNDKFVNIYDKSVINQQLFKRRISGLVSYYAGTTDRKGMPEEVIHPPHMLEMSTHQYKLYLQERFNETRRERKGKRGTTRNIEEATGSAFRTYSRMVCNFSFPAGITRPKPISSRDFRTFEKYQDVRLDPSELDLDDVMDEIDPSKIEGFKSPSRSKKSVTGDLDDDELYSGQEKVLTKKQREETYAKLLTESLLALERMKDQVFSTEALTTYSPKMNQIMENIKSAPGNQGLVYIYTEFRILEGVRIMGSILQYNGFEKMDYTDINSFDDFKAKNKKGQLRYGIISSEEDSKKRKILMEVFNHPENAHGEYVKVIMGTSASSEGIDLMRTTQIHIMEPYWNMVRNNQVIGRGARFGSHLDLPLDEQVVHVYSYQMTLTKPQISEIVELIDNPKEARSTDQHIHGLAMMKDHINSQFLMAVKEGAVDCALNYLVNVKKDPTLKCIDIPTESNKYLYVPDINQDPEDQESIKNIKYEEYRVGTLTLNEVVYGYKVDAQNGRPILDPPFITHEGKIYHQILTLYDPDLLENGIEVKRKYYAVGTTILVDVN